MLSRPLYRFNRFDLGNVASAQRAQALRLQIRQWSPYTKTEQYVVWRREDALVWAWDADRLATDLAAQNLKRQSTRVIPESLLHPPSTSGVRLVAALDGVEGQRWEAGQLVHSRWWAAVQSAGDWLNFQRDAGIGPDKISSIPTAQSPPLAQQPWAQSLDIGQSDGLASVREARIVRIAALAFAIFSIWFGVEFIKARQAIGQLQTQLADSEKNARPLIESRRKAYAALANIETLQASNPYPAQLALMAQISNALPKEGATLSEWNYQDGKLRITIASTNKLSSSFLVKRIQDAGWFNNVQAIANDASSTTLAMESRPQNDILWLDKVPAELSGAAKSAKSAEPLNSSPQISP